MMNSPQNFQPQEIQHSHFPLTDLQQAYWIGEQDGYYLQAPALVYRSYFMADIDIDRLEYALTQVVNRHPALRTEFLSDCTQRIKINSQEYYRIQYSDIRAKNHNRVTHEIHHPHIPESESFSCHVIRDEQGCSIHFAFRLIALDGKSILQFINEVAALYADEVLPEAPTLSHHDFVLKQLAQRNSAAYQTSMNWWQQRIKTLPAAPELPIVDPEDFPERSSFKRRTYQLSPTLSAELRNVARRCETTLNAVLCTVYADILRMWAKDPSFTLNLLYSQRLSEGPEFEQVLGNFTSTLLVEITAKGATTFKQRAQMLQGQLYRDMAHSRISGVEVIRAMQQPAGFLPVMPVVFASLLGTETQEAAITPTDIDWKVLGGDMSTPQVYLDHQVYMEDNHLILNWDSVDEVFLPGVVEEMFAAYSSAIEQLCSSDADINSPMHPRLPERYLASRKAANTTFKTLPRGLLHDFICPAVTRFATHTALIDGETKLTYEQLWNTSTCLALKLQHYGVKPNDLVAVVADRSWRQVAALLAVVRAGGAYLPIATELPHERKRFLLSQHGVKVALIDLEQTAPAPPEGTQLPVLSLKDELSLNQIPAEQLDSHDQQPENLAYVIFTSGSTGTPKGVAISHQAVVNTLQDTIARFTLESRDRVLGVSAFNFDLSVFDIFATLSCGATLILPRASTLPEPDEWVRIISKYQVTVWNSVPALVDMLTEFAGCQAGILLQSLRLIMMSGDWIPLRLPERLKKILPDTRLVSLGGATEAAIWSNYYDIKEEQEKWNSIPYGWPLANQYFHVLNSNLQHSPTWVTGHLYIGGLGLANGYYRDEERTAESFIIHPESGERLYKTGDLGRYRPNGCLEFLGRNDSQVKIRGFRIELGEIEAALTDCANVHDSVVVIRTTGSGEQQLVGYYIADSNSTTPITIRNALVQQLPSYMVPTFIVPIEHFPVTSNGKVDRKQLAALPVETTFADEVTHLIAPRNETERLLVTIWEKLLQTRVPSVTSDFFASGGSSLLAVRLLTEISLTFDIRLPLASLLNHGSVEKQAQLLTEKRQVETDSRAPLVMIRDGVGPIVVAVHPVGGNILCYRSLAKILPAGTALYGMQSPGDSSPRTITQLAMNYNLSLDRLASNRPIHLLGWSMGGVIALEMARLLGLKHHHVNSVTLLDSWVSAAPGRAVEKLDDELLMRGFMSDFSDGKYLPDEWVFPSFHTADDNSQVAITQLKAKKIVPDNFLEEELVQLFQEYRENYLALLHHQPILAEIPLHLVRASDATIRFPGLEPFSPPESFGSTDLIKVTRITGDHFSIINNNSLQQIITALGDFSAQYEEQL